MPKVCEQPEAVAAPKTQTNLLLDNVSKIECKHPKSLDLCNYFCSNRLDSCAAYTDQMEKTRFVFKFVQAARSRKSKKKQTSLLSSMTSDTLSMDSSSTVSVTVESLHLARILHKIEAFCQEIKSIQQSEQN